MLNGNALRGRQIDSTLGGRPTCYSCLRPESHCVCQLIRPFEAHCNILILQHPNEWRKYYSTAKLVTKTITNAKALRGVAFGAGVIEKALAGQRPYILFPSKTAVDCESVKFESNSTVLVIDGTWGEAGKIMLRNPILQQIPCLTFGKALRSNYRIRKQPKENYLSTIESVGHLLRLNSEAYGLKADSAKYGALFDVFEQMVQQQLSYFPRMRTAKMLEILGD